MYFIRSSYFNKIFTKCLSVVNDKVNVTIIS